MLHVFYVTTIWLSGCYHSQAGLKILDIQEFFNKIHGDPIFGSIISKMESKFHKYYFHIPIIYGLSILTDSCMKMKVFKII